MAALQEVFAVLLGAESEARRTVEEARREAEEILRKNKEAFTTQRENRLLAAREQARSIVDSARAAAEAEVSQITEQGQQERARMEKRFQENCPAVISTLVAEVAESALRNLQNKEAH